MMRSLYRHPLQSVFKPVVIIVTITAIDIVLLYI